MPEPFPDLTSESDHVVAPSESLLNPDDNSTAMNGVILSEAIIDTYPGTRTSFEIGGWRVLRAAL